MRRDEIKARYGYLVLDWLEKKYGKSELYWMTEIAIAVRGVRAAQERFPGLTAGQMERWMGAIGR